PHRAPEPPGVHGRAGARVRARATLPARPHARLLRRRRLQARERHVRAPGGRPRAAFGRPSRARRAPSFGSRRTDGRRRVRCRARRERARDGWALPRPDPGPDRRVRLPRRASGGLLDQPGPGALPVRRRVGGDALQARGRAALRGEAGEAHLVAVYDGVIWLQEAPPSVVLTYWPLGRLTFH